MLKPNKKDYFTDSGLHSDMKAWAKSKAKKSLKVSVEYDDGSIDCNFHTFSPFTEEVPYKALDGETYTVDVDTLRYKPDFLPNFYDGKDEELTLKEIKDRVKHWLKECSVAGFTKITFTKVDS